MYEIKLKTRYKYAGDIFKKLVDVGLDIEAATAFLNEVEDADVQEVVRCKDCKYFSEFQHCGILGFCEPNEYCSRGERRKE